MTLILPRDIQKRFEERWSARAAQAAESFHAKAQRLKQAHPVVPEGARPIEPPRENETPEGRPGAEGAHR
ncbi:hypothetical protein [Bradyrhizobium sp. LHD-71]|uniref:hypothetical protein n=1 Tax=Bradyrhizobium sp. LHD-71 TaxID=3072141 RepID=UPI00280F7A89|nr:hypothetical protein [Bradyrhizobium sp. LHD-71]MDQ8729495.1 hypothetical protein [Bradyrhizobium sp. LHD-71]